MAINYSANTFDLNPQAEGFNLWPHSDGKANVILHKKHVWVFFLNSHSNFQSMSCIHYQQLQLLKTDKSVALLIVTSTEQGKGTQAKDQFLCAHSCDRRAVP